MSKIIPCRMSLIITAIAALCAGCGSPSAWYPSGTVTVVDSYEVESGGVKSAVVTVTIANTGASMIVRNTFTGSARTDIRTYWKTISDEKRILPGSSVKTTFAISYAATTEILALGGVAVADAFFE